MDTDEATLRSTRIRFVALGIALGAVAPLGLLLLRWLLGQLEPGLWHELHRDTAGYLYVWLSTMLVFTVFGYFSGRATDALRKASFTDPLTGLWNRRYLRRRTIAEIKGATRRGLALTFAIVDVDRLKQLNDEGGHEQGDAALKLVAAALSSQVRATDVVARWGGDEFAILIPHTKAASASLLAQRIHARLRELSRARKDGGDAVTVSIGIAELDEAHDNESALFAAADVALYAAKRRGRNRTEIAHPSLPPIRDSKIYDAPETA